MTLEESKKLAEDIVKALEDRKAKNIEIIQSPRLEAVTDYFVICSGTSSTHLRGIADLEKRDSRKKDLIAHILKDMTRQVGF